MTDGFVGCIASESMLNPVFTSGVQLLPPFVLLNTPPVKAPDESVAANIVFGFVGSKARALTALLVGRPLLIGGQLLPPCVPAYRVEGAVWFITKESTSVALGKLTRLLLTLVQVALESVLLKTPPRVPA